MTTLLAHGRGIVVAERQDGADLRALVLGTPGLERFVSGILLDPESFAEAMHDAAGQNGTRQNGTRHNGARRPDGAAPARGVPVGVSATEQALAAEPGDPGTVLGRRLATWAAGGAALAGWTMDVEAGDPEECTRRARLAAAWAAGCRDAGLPAVLRCRIAVPPRASLETAETRHREAMSRVADALLRRGVDPASIVLALGPVLPGHRATDVATADDVACATVRALRDAGLDEVGGVAVHASRRLADLPAHLAAVQWRERRWCWGFAADLALLAPVAATRGGRPDLARQELRSCLEGLVTVLRASAVLG